MFTVATLGLIVYFGSTVNLGKKTFFGHMADIWGSDEARDFKRDVGRTAKPMLDDFSEQAKPVFKKVKDVGQTAGEAVIGELWGDDASQPGQAIHHPRARRDGAAARAPSLP